MARAAYEAALDWAKTYTAGGPQPIINYQYPGYVLGDVAAKIEAARYFCWKGAHYLDQHDFHGEMIGAMNKIFCTEMMIDCVYKCMQVVGVNSVDKKYLFERYLREASILPLYDAGNFGMQRRRVHGVMADPVVQPARPHGGRGDRVHQGNGRDRHRARGRGTEVLSDQCVLARGPSRDLPRSGPRSRQGSRSAPRSHRYIAGRSTTTLMLPVASM